MAEYKAQFKPQNWVEQQYEEYKKLPLDNNTFKPYMALSIAILKRFVVDLYGAYQIKNYKRVEQLNERIRKNGICELVGIDCSYLDRLARTYDCSQYNRANDKEDDFIDKLLGIKENEDE